MKKLYKLNINTNIHTNKIIIKIKLIVKISK